MSGVGGHGCFLRGWRLLVSLLSGGDWLLWPSFWSPQSPQMSMLFDIFSVKRSMWPGHEGHLSIWVGASNLRTHLFSLPEKGADIWGAGPQAEWPFRVGGCGILAGKGLERVPVRVRVSSDIISPCESHLPRFPGSGAVHLSKSCDGTPHLARATDGWGIHITRSPALGTLCSRFMTQTHEQRTARSLPWAASSTGATATVNKRPWRTELW